MATSSLFARRITGFAALVPIAALLLAACGDTATTAGDAGTDAATGDAGNMIVADLAKPGNSSDANPVNSSDLAKPDNSTDLANSGATDLANSGSADLAHSGSADLASRNDLATPSDLAIAVAPTVTSTRPAANAIAVSNATPITATFSETMEPLTIDAATFTLHQNGAAIAGTVSYAGTTATFKPQSALGLDLTYLATITTGATSVGGKPLAADFTWSFTTTAALPLGPAPVLLGTSGDYVILAKSAISTVPTSAVTGDIGLSPAAATFITGFALVRAGTYWTTPQVVGKAYAADNDPPTPTLLTTAVGDMQTAYTDAAGRANPNFLNLGAGAIGGLTLAPGLYHWTSNVTVASGVTIKGGANDVWIFQTTGNLTMATAQLVTLSGGAQAKNIFWQVAGDVDLGTSAHLEGIVLCQTGIALGSKASSNGRLLAQTAVTLNSSIVTEPAQ